MTQRTVCDKASQQLSDIQFCIVCRNLHALSHQLKAEQIADDREHAKHTCDDFTDVTMGQIVDRSKPTKDGKFKPWIKRMCGPVAIASFLIYQSGFANMPYGFNVFPSTTS